MSVKNRIEHDPLGPVSVPSDRYYGAQTARAIENFPISGIAINSMPFLTQALAHVKMAAAQANCAEGLLPNAKRDAIVHACQEVLAGKHYDEFLVDVFQGGAGTSSNMNMNEVLANRASELLGGVRGVSSIRTTMSIDPSRPMMPMPPLSAYQSSPQAAN